MNRITAVLCASLSLLLAPVTVEAQAPDTLEDCIAQLRLELPAHPQVSADTFDRQTLGAQDLRPVIDAATRSQPEFEVPIWDYLARRVDARRVSQGAELLMRESGALASMAARYGVEAATAVAVFGVETDYGRVAGRYPVVDATLSRACLNLKSAERKQQLFSALRLLQEGVVQPADFMGSWAGAFGMTQFMPGTFVKYMSDGPGQAPADIVHSVPDALATTARFLRGLGWVEARPWGIEVKVPASLEASNALESDHACLANGQAQGKCKTVAQWQDAGVTTLAGTALAASRSGLSGTLSSTRAALLMPAGIQGPAWLVTPNYQALWRYNRADAYALAIGLLSDALRGLPPPRVAWPTDDAGVSRDEFSQLQALLLGRGHCDIRVDGADGPKTQAAIREEELRVGRPSTGRAGMKLLVRLRDDGPLPGACPSPVAADAAASAPTIDSVDSVEPERPTPSPSPAPRR